MAIIKSIYWEPEDREEIVYKHPSREITLGSVLTVNESQEALFFKNGALCDSFGPGRHVLSTSNLPVLSKFVNLASGGETTFAAEVWFVSKLNKRDMFWGTGGLRIVDPYFEIPIKISSRGQYGIRIVDSALFVKKFVGTFDNASAELIDNQLRIDVVEAVKVSISKYMKENNVNINELGVSYRELSKTIMALLRITFEEYGVELLNFNIESIDFDERDKGYQAVMEGIAEKARLNKLGVSYVQDKQLDIAQTAAGNEGAGTFMGAGMGLGMGVGMGAGMGHTMGQAIGGAMQSTPQPPQLSFYVAQNGQTTGPFAMDAIQNMVMQGTIVRDTYVYKVGGSAWTLAANTPELAHYFPMMPPPPPVR
ncbi:MAG: SPFH domain-containing protein [Alistipes sp.]|nr:SPFH domain-containing protein [Alistipes sp.]